MKNAGLHYFLQEPENGRRQESTAEHYSEPK